MCIVPILLRTVENHGNAEIRKAVIIVKYIHLYSSKKR